MTKTFKKTTQRTPLGLGRKLYPYTRASCLNIGERERKTFPIRNMSKVGNGKTNNVCKGKLGHPGCVVV
jgi:hypothetical protein